jgi:hypothetical protein
MAVFEPLFKILDDSGVRCVVEDGVAVVLHGQAHMTTQADQHDD